MEYLSLLLLFGMFSGSSSLTMEQLKNAGKVPKKNCMGKHNVTEEQVGRIGEGVFIPDRDVKCYIACMYQIAQTLTKSGKVNVEGAMKQIDMMFPPEMKEPTKKSLLACKDVPKKHKDICEAAFAAAKCAYDFDPKNFFFP